MSETTAKVAEKQPHPPLSPVRIALAEQKRQTYLIVVAEGTPFEALLTPEYWVHVAAKLRPMDRIEVQPEDGSYFAELMVLRADQLHARVVVITHVKIDENAKGLDADSPYFVKWGSPATRFRVLRKSDNKVVKDGFVTKAEAETWAAQQPVH